MFDKESIRKIKQARKKWEEDTLRKAKERFEVKESTSKFYTPADIADNDFLEKVGFPGEYPFTAGVYPMPVPGSGPQRGEAYLSAGGKLKRAGRYSGYGTPEDTRDYYNQMYAIGWRSGPNLAFDLPTQIGLDANNPLARGEVGRVGVAVSSLQDFEIIYSAFKNDINLDKIASNWTINAPASIILAMYMAIAEQRKIPISQLRGTPQNDILKEFMARGTYIFPPKHSMRLVRDIMVFCTKNMPNMNIVSVSGTHLRSAGASREQTVGFTMCNAIAYVELGMKAGLDVDQFMKRFTFNTFGGGMEILKEIALRRAARRMFARIMKERFKAKDPRSWMLREAGGYMTGAYNMIPQRPLNNLTRGIIGGVAAAMAGDVPSVEPPYDEPLGLGWSLEAQQLALDAARIIQHECRLTEVTDPFAGSYYMESMTDEIERGAQKLIDEVDKMGGIVKALESGFVQQNMARAVYEYQKEIWEKKRVVVGQNMFTGEEEMEVTTSRLIPHPYDPNKRFNAEQKQITKLQKLRKDRDNAKATRTLAALKAAAKDESVNLMPLIFDAVKAYATVGEICDALRSVFGEASLPTGV